MRVVIADDVRLLREGIASLVRDQGIEVVAQAASADELLAAVDEHEPDLAIVDIRMPPTQTDEGIQAAHELRRRHPGMGIVLLSQYVEVGVATRLLAESPQRFGYLLKDRVSDPADFAGSLLRVAGGGTALDPQVVSALLADPKDADPLHSLSQRERSVLELVAEGRSNKAISERLDITQGAVQKHVSTIFNKLGLPAGEDDDRRILAVLAYLRPELRLAAHRDDLEVLRGDGDRVAAPVGGALDDREQVALERGLAVGADRGECLHRRAVPGAEQVDHRLGVGEAPRVGALAREDRADLVTEQLRDALLGAPPQRRGEPGRGRGVCGGGAEPVAEEALGRPGGEADQPARAADAQRARSPSAAGRARTSRRTPTARRRRRRRRRAAPRRRRSRTPCRAARRVARSRPRSSSSGT